MSYPQPPPWPAPRPRSPPSPAHLVLRETQALTPPQGEEARSTWLDVPSSISRPKSTLSQLDEYDDVPTGLSTSVSPRKLFDADEDVHPSHMRTPAKGRRTRSSTVASQRSDVHLSPYAYNPSSYASSLYGSPSPTALRKSARSPIKTVGTFVPGSPTQQTSPIKSPAKVQHSPTKPAQQQPPPPYSRYNTYTYSVKHQQPRSSQPPFPSLFPVAPKSQASQLQVADDDAFFNTPSKHLTYSPITPRGVSHAFIDTSTPASAISFSIQAGSTPVARTSAQQQPKPKVTSTPELESRTVHPRYRNLGFQRLRNVKVGLGDVRNTAGFWIAMYFIFNLGLTLYNKGVLVRFPFPYTLTALHTLCGTIGTCWLWYTGYFVPARLTTKENITLSLFSILYTLNIAISNVSLQLVTVPFHQVVRASAPIPTILLTFAIYGHRGRGLLGVGQPRLLSLAPVILGVMFATYGDYYFTTWGLVLTLAGTILAALKTIITNLLQTTSTTTTAPVQSGPLLTGGPVTPKTPHHRPPLAQAPVARRLKLDPLDLLLRMSPLAFLQCVIYAYLSGEMSGIQRLSNGHFSARRCWALMINGCIAFGLNIVSFTANKKSGPLTMTVAANVKQVLTIVLAVVIFNVHITLTNGLGILLTLLGGMWYAAIEYQEKQKGRAREPLSLTTAPPDRKGTIPEKMMIV